jgi:dihydroorotase
MNLLIRQVTIADPSSSFHKKVVDVLIVDGVIQSIADKIGADKVPDGTKVLEGNGQMVSPGWFDLRAYFREPGDEPKETIRSGQNAAARGGFTGVLLMPSTHPMIQTRSAVEFVMSKGNEHPVEIIQAGCLTENREGKELTGMYDMLLGGAGAFTDDKRSIADSGVMLRALQYAGNIGANVITYADDPSVSGKGIANESTNTTLLGFKGSPDIAEEIALQRDLSLVEYTNQPLHVSGISSARAVAVVRDAKKKGLKITAEVYAHHLLLDDSALNDFDSNFKVKPPLRSSDDKAALIAGVLDGTIDAIASDHSPEDHESKVVEFDYSAFGMISLESTFGVIAKAFGAKLTPEVIATVLSKNPRQILGLPEIRIAVGEKANLTIFNLHEEWELSAAGMQSLSRNTPFIGTKFKGKVKGVYNRGQFVESL